MPPSEDPHRLRYSMCARAEAACNQQEADMLKYLVSGNAYRVLRCWHIVAIYLGAASVWTDQTFAEQTAAAQDSQALRAEAQMNVAAIRQAYEAFSRGDIDTVMAAFSPDIEWYVPGRGPLSR